jgi:hypothetical protein
VTAFIAMSETELQEHIRTLVKSYRLEAQHIFDSRRCWCVGYPDLTVIGPRGILFRELKSESGDLTPAQRRIGSKITTAGGDWCVWRPRDLLDRTIHRQLEAIA